jgi:hypothetical protein
MGTEPATKLADSERIQVGSDTDEKARDFRASLSKGQGSRCLQVEMVKQISNWWVALVGHTERQVARTR